MTGKALLALSVAACLGCARDPVAPLATTLATDATSYVTTPGTDHGEWREHSLVVVARFTNPSPYTVMLDRCSDRHPYPTYDVEHVDGAEHVAYGGDFPCELAMAFAVAPGETRVDSLPLRGPVSVSGITGRPIGVFEGRFRISYRTYACRDDVTTCAAPLSGTARSNVFTIRLGE